jgi:hypothetical protein
MLSHRCRHRPALDAYSAIDRAAIFVVPEPQQAESA